MSEDDMKLSPLNFPLNFPSAMMMPNKVYQIRQTRHIKNEFTCIPSFAQRSPAPLAAGEQPLRKRRKPLFPI